MLKIEVFGSVTIPLVGVMPLFPTVQLWLHVELGEKKKKKEVGNQ